MAERVRAGERVTTGDLLSTLRRLDSLAWSEAGCTIRRTLLLALWAGSTREGMHAAVLDQLPIGVSGTVRAVLLRDDDPLSMPFPDNPWLIRAGDSLAGTLERLWANVDAPGLTSAIAERVQALVLIDLRDGPILGYVRMDDRYAPARPDATPPFDRRHGLQWEADLSMFIGNPPAYATKHRCGFSFPEAMRRFYAMHGGLRTWSWQLCGPDEVLPWNEMLHHEPPRAVSTEDSLESIRSDQLLMILSYCDDRSELLDIRDPDDIVVRSWAEGRLDAGAGLAFFEWLDARRSLILASESVDDS